MSFLLLFLIGSVRAICLFQLLPPILLHIFSNTMASSLQTRKPIRRLLPSLQCNFMIPAIAKVIVVLHILTDIFRIIQNLPQLRSLCHLLHRPRMLPSSLVHFIHLHHHHAGIRLLGGNTNEEFPRIGISGTPLQPPYKIRQIRCPRFLLTVRIEDGEIIRVRVCPAKGDLEGFVQVIKGRRGGAGEGSCNGRVLDIIWSKVEVENVVWTSAGGFVGFPDRCLAFFGAIFRVLAAGAGEEFWCRLRCLFGAY